MATVSIRLFIALTTRLLCSEAVERDGMQDIVVGPNDINNGMHLLVRFEGS
jgi:hypothetical protein